MDNNTEFRHLASTSLKPATAINISHQCMVRSWTCTGTRSFLAELLTLPSRRSIVNQLRANGRNWIRKCIITTMKNKNKSEFCVVFHNIMLSFKMWSVPHANKRQETTISLLQCHPPWPGSCQCWYNNQLHTPASERQRLSKRETT